MDRKTLQKEIVSCIWSKDLRKYIEESGYTFSEDELLAIAFQFAPDYEERLRLLALLAEDAPSVSEHASKCIAWQHRCLDEFRRTEENEVYELRIKTDPDAYEERYLCATYERAIELIDDFYRSYASAEERESSRYTIGKRKIIRPGQDFCEDWAGEAFFTAGGRLVSVEPKNVQSEHGECSGKCYECPQRCISNTEVNFPELIPDKSVVRYRTHGGEVKYGLHLSLSQPGPSDSCYVIDLDGEMLTGRDYEKQWGGHWHAHIEWPYVETVPLDSLTPQQREDCEAFCAWWDAKEF